MDMSKLQPLRTKKNELATELWDVAIFYYYLFISIITSYTGKSKL